MEMFLAFFFWPLVALLFLLAVPVFFLHQKQNKS
jgi:hypothetical protein